MKYLACALMVSLATGPAMAVADGFIWLNVSVKFVVDPATGQPPAGTDDANLRQVFDLMNRWLANTWSGYRVRLVDLNGSGNFLRIGGLNDTTGPSKWYTADLKNETPSTVNYAFEAAAKAASALYAWNYSAMNLYINNGTWSRANFPSSGHDVVISSFDLISNDDAPEYYRTNNYKIAGNLLHEMGHFFELYHTFSSGNDDGIADTALDHDLDPPSADPRNEGAVRNDIAFLNFSHSYGDLTPAEKQLVDNTANNAMSYRQLFYDDPAQGKVLSDAERFGPTRFVFTELQMNKWADIANNQRAATASGKMKFVDAAVAESGTGTSTSPFKTLAAGITAASAAGTDIVMLRQGTYTAATLSKPVTLRASHSGPVVIQKP